MKKNNNFKLALMAIGIAINVIGPFLAMTFRIPIYLDAIGTNLIAMLFGPVEGVIVGVVGSLLCGVTFDVSSIWYAPVQIFNGIVIAYLYRAGWITMKKMFWSMLIAILFISTSSALITVYVYGGITPSASTYIYLLLKYIGFSSVVAAFIMQMMTDYVNQIVSCWISLVVIKRLPKNMRGRFNNIKESN
ncbi:ECF transporter S component [Clostridium massiliamazoniense]|uniref:ECF transporter S component n=1 Tax=Clostridium massiliamazoniense TaxID=1347366 RepID=UPI0006D7CFF5|nr:ECF transporter S component [Clostridium massiliamazoniense]